MVGMAAKPAILTEALRKSFGKTPALQGLDLVAEEGTILGVLGPNGAGKTTAVRILTTLLAPDSGRAEVAGMDVVKRPREVRARIGLAGQYAAVDENLTGHENLVMFGQLYHLSGAAAKRRTSELLESFDLVEAGRRLLKTYSGGMRRRLDVAVSVIVSPPIIFFDEPTTGLDPRGRLAVWEVIRGVVAKGTTVFLTTQYLEEADHLADQIIVIDRGRVIAKGTAEELKTRIGGERLELTLAPSADVQTALQVLRQHSSGEIQIEGRHLSVPVLGGAQHLPAIVRDLDLAHIALADLALRRPTLDDVFLSLTSRVASEVDRIKPMPTGNSTA